MSHRIALFIGTRPEAIKMAPVVTALAADPRFEPLVVNTGQHRELLDQVVDLFRLPVHHRLEVMQPNQSLAGLTARLITAIDGVLAETEPQMALVQGDTTTVLAATLASFYRRIPVGHVEAGLRTGNLLAPFPEEANRRLTTPLVTLHFAPTTESAANLFAEHVPAERIFVTGNTVVDALHQELRRQEEPMVAKELEARLAKFVGAGFGERPFVLVTGHRRENFGDGFQQICTALTALAQQFPRHLFIYPVHLNPNVQQVVGERLGKIENIRLIAPQPYDAFQALLARCALVLTDSGGVQEEAPSLGKPVLVMRDTTERPEGVTAGVVQLVGATSERITSEVSRLLSDEAAYRDMSEAVSPYGDGHAAERILTAMADYLGG